MSTPIALPSDLATYLGSSVDDDRATLLIQLAQDKCEAILTPLPDTAMGVVLDIAARAYSNPTNAQSQTTGPFSASFGGVAGGLWLTRANLADLRRLADSGGAFTIDPTPEDASATNYWAQVPESPADLWTNPPYYGDWDWPPETA